eukprot:scaffold1609_cov91-Cylindrotheca_fusiformis.AAC.5
MWILAGCREGARSARDDRQHVVDTPGSARSSTVSEGQASQKARRETEGRCGRKCQKGSSRTGFGMEMSLLGAWVNNQRRAKRRRVLKEDRENRLNGVGLKWSFLASKGEGWDSMFDWLLEFIEERKKEDILK